MKDQPVSSIMRRQVVTVDRGAKVAEVVKDMATRNIGAVVVVEGGNPVGVFTERDVLKRVVARGVNLEQASIHLVMSPQPVSVEHTETIGNVAFQLHHRNLRHMLVTEGGKLAGIVSIRDVLGAVLGISEGGEAFEGE